MPIRSARELGESIRRARKQRDLSQTELADIASVRQALISDLEKGVTSARLDTILKVLAALDLDLAISQRADEPFDPTGY